jgi:hypothetical protein
MKGRIVIGSREDAELRAREMIDDWLKKRPTQKNQSQTDAVPFTMESEVSLLMRRPFAPVRGTHLNRAMTIMI